MVVNGATMGNTPIVADLSRKDHQVVRIQMDGYEPFETTLARGVSGWVAGNILFGGLIGLAVDAISGGMYKLTPAQIEGQLGRIESAEADGDALYIAVVLEPDPSWEQVGQLARAE